MQFLRFWTGITTYIYILALLMTGFSVVQNPQWYYLYAGSALVTLYVARSSERSGHDAPAIRQEVTTVVARTKIFIVLQTILILIVY